MTWCLDGVKPLNSILQSHLSGTITGKQYAHIYKSFQPAVDFVMKIKVLDHVENNISTVCFASIYS